MAARPVDKDALIKRVLLALGLPPEYDQEGEDQSSGQIDIVYESCLDRCLSLHDWSFAKRTVKLTRLSETPDNGWQYAFQLPGNRIEAPQRVLRSVQTPNDINRHFTIEEDHLFTSCPDCYVVINLATAPSEWGVAFRAAFEVALKAYLAIPLLQDERMQKEQHQLAFGTPSEKGRGGLINSAIAQDLANSPRQSNLYENDPLTSAHGSDGSTSPFDGPWNHWGR